MYATLFVIAVTAYDVAFAWQYRASFQDWELNPVAVRLGIGGAILYRTVSTIAGLIIIHRSRAAFRWSAMAVLVLVHIYLLSAYAQ